MFKVFQKYAGFCQRKSGLERVEGVGLPMNNVKVGSLRAWLLELKTLQPIPWGPGEDVPPGKGCHLPPVLTLCSGSHPTLSPFGWSVCFMSTLAVYLLKH